MTPREKAIELYNQFYDLPTVVIDIKVKKHVTKQCAIIDVENTLDVLKEIYEQFSYMEIKWKILWYESVKEALKEL